MSSSARHLRLATHAGSWYQSDASELSSLLRTHLEGASRQVPSSNSLKAVICPHAGYAYCGATAAHSWIQVDAASIDRVIVFGPSHHVYLTSCALPSASHYETPFGDISLDEEAINSLRRSRKFGEFRMAEDQNEHSIELQLPYLKFVMGSKRFSLIPIIVGDVSNSQLEEYGKLLLPHFLDERTLFVISSDFCHWGKRFGFTFIPSDCESMPLYKAIEKLDMEGIRLLEELDLEGFQRYLHSSRNTICGQHPIRMLLQLVQLSGVSGFCSKLLDYSQSQQATEHHESSVSYAALFFHCRANTQTALGGGGSNS